MSKNRPNLLFLMTDHQRADSIGMVQCGKEVTPNLNKLASLGTHFTRAYNTCPLCVPARTALATGKYPTSTGVVLNDWKGKSAGDHKPIHQVLSENGYRVAHVGVHHIKVKPKLEDRVSFESFVTAEDHQAFLEARGLELLPNYSEHQREVLEDENGELVPRRYSSTRTTVWHNPAEVHRDWFFADKAVEFISKQAGEQPFALFLCMWAPHPPLFVPEPFASMFNPDQIGLPANVGKRGEGEPGNRKKSVPAQLGEGLSEDDWRKVWAAHLGLTNLADHGIGRILDALKKSGQADNSVVLFTSDHGDQLGQHGMFQKFEMYEQSVNVPMIWRGPGIQKQKTGSLVSHLDVFPTVCDLLGLDQPEGLEGMSLNQHLVSGADLPERTLFSQYSGNGRIAKATSVRRAAITKDRKYVFDPYDIEELYNLDADPLEMNNLAQDPLHRGLVADLRAQSKEWAESHRDWIEF